MNKPATEAEELAKLNACVDAFSRRMKARLAAKLREGRRGWDDPEWPTNVIIAGLEKHVENGNMVDAANLAMFVWYKKCVKCK